MEFHSIQLDIGSSPERPRRSTSAWWNSQVVLVRALSANETPAAMLSATSYSTSLPRTQVAGQLNALVFIYMQRERSGACTSVSDDPQK